MAKGQKRSNREKKKPKASAKKAAAVPFTAAVPTFKGNSVRVGAKRS
jgi:hypothetical protein